MSSSLCPVDCSSPGSYVHRILRARILASGTSFLLPLMETQNQGLPPAPCFAQHGASPLACQELWRHVAATEVMSQHPTCLGGPMNLQGLGFGFSIHTDSEPGGPYQPCGPWKVTTRSGCQLSRPHRMVRGRKRVSREVSHIGPLTVKLHCPPWVYPAGQSERPQ